jgi:hypothetical protein
MRARSTSRKSALACRTESTLNFPDDGNSRQVSGTSDYAAGTVNCFYRTIYLKMQHCALGPKWDVAGIRGLVTVWGVTRPILL